MADSATPKELTGADPDWPQNGPSAGDLRWLATPEGRIRSLDEGAAADFGYGSADDLNNLFELVHPRDQRLIHELLAAVMTRQTEPSAALVRILDGHGDWRCLELTPDPDQPLTDDGVVLGSRDVTDEKVRAEQRARAVFYDTGTSLPAEALFVDRLRQAVGRASRGVDPIAVMLLEIESADSSRLDDDELLRRFSGRLLALIRPGDSVAHLGQRQFGLLLEGVELAADATRIADRIADALEMPLMTDGGEVEVIGNLGISLYSPEHFGPDDLLYEAGVALHYAKTAGRFRYVVFEPSMASFPGDHLKDVIALRTAITKGGLTVTFRPQVDLGTRSVASVHAFVGWNHPQHGSLQFPEFAALAERSGLVSEVGEWMLRTAAPYLQRWRRECTDLRLSLDLSPSEVRRSEFPQELMDRVRRAGLAPEALQLQIADTALLRDTDLTLSKLHELREFGFSLTLDKFGSGYSSLGHLNRIAVSGITVDRALIARLGRSQRTNRIVQAVAVLAHSLGMRVAGEGVETNEQLSFLEDADFDYASGPFFAKPLAADGLSAFLGEYSQASERNIA